MTKKTTSNAVLAANGGLDSERALGTAHDILKYHDLRQPIMYHLIFKGSDSIATYQAARKELMQHLRRSCRAEYFGAFENDPMKGLHAHLFLVVETAKTFPDEVIDIRNGGYLQRLAERKGIKTIHVAPPKNPMHGGQLFARPVADGGKLADCLEWATYAFKVRSKAKVPCRETYFNSTIKANKERREATKFRTNKKPTQTQTSING